jgi:uncharacterized UPF0160 family protein
MEKRVIVTHNEYFHPDDVFGVAVLQILLEGKFDVEVVRTRDSKKISKADYVLDVGGVYDPEKKRFDHHQGGGAGERTNGIPYASFGLLWKEYGEEISGSLEVFEAIDEKLVQPIDAEDNGVSICKEVFEDVSPYRINNFIFAFHPNWKEDPKVIDERFFELVRFAKMILEREIFVVKGKFESQKETEKAYEAADDKRLIILEGRFSWAKVLDKYEEPLFVIFPSVFNKNWHVRAVGKESGTFENRKDFPESWAGKQGEDLVKETGVSDASFCHNKLFLAVAESREGAIALAKLALNA